MKGRIRQRSPDTWQISYDVGRDALGNRKTKAVTVRGTKVDAQRKLRELLTTLDQGDIPLRQWLERWMQEAIVPARREGTIDHYRRAIRNHILPHIGNITLSQFGPAQVQALESRVGQNVGPRTVNLVHIILSGAFRYAARLELIHRNPVSLVSPPPAKRKDVMPPDIPTVRHALELARGDGHDLYPVVMLLCCYPGSLGQWYPRSLGHPERG